MDIKNVKKRYVWQDKPPPYQVGKDQFYPTHVKKDIEGWVDAKIYRPCPYDLLWLKTKDKTKPGWWNGTQWESLRLGEEFQVLYWKMHS